MSQELILPVHMQAVVIKELKANGLLPVMIMSTATQAM